ncbi:alanine dehydrogenase [Helicobacter muridarum]|uniref:alanine dehydrogenase n=1 Tax=Helicobacter muridarum TaxID=216 RepID=A0A099U056_9HELI|nr:alanine dehydrogenase [Helicobacter muridarum]TLE01094.1 alanine dehydrogenase [Helicobacter muridarum]STQ85957.1 alanine dehydrogenase [Helicobacter muridarum]
MNICVPKEIMNHEHRVGLVPSDVALLKDSNPSHKIYIEDGLGSSIGYNNNDYEIAGATVLKNAKEIWECADLLVKCKEPTEEEFRFLRKDMVLYSFLDLAYSSELARALIDSKVTSICGETIAGPMGNYPILSAMSEVTGKFAAQHAATLLAANYGGRGMLIGGCAGVSPAKAVVVGGGVVGMNAAKVLVGMGADVWVLDIDVCKVSNHPLVINNQVKLLYSNENSIAEALKGADILIGAVLITATSTPKIITREHLRMMNKGGVVLDVSVDLGGCMETSKQTTHDNPTYIEEDLVHYGVPNIPGVIARTSSITYSYESLPYIKVIANQGWKEMLRMPGAIGGLNAYNGSIALKSIAKAFNMPYIDTTSLL